MDWKPVLSYLGIIFVVLACLMLVPIIVSLVYEEGVYIPFMLAAAVSLIIGAVLVKKFKRGNLTLGSAMVLACLSFTAVSLVGSIAYLDHLSPLDAVFESVSGFTTTGLSTVRPESLPYSILFWRSLTQWLGGAGMLIAVILLLSSPGMSAYYMYRSEAKTHRIEANVYGNAKKVLAIYGMFTAAGILLFVLAGMPAFDSVNHAMTGISTGGFSVKNDSIGHYSNFAIEAVAMLLMVLGATSIFLHKKLFAKNFSEYARNSETQLFWALVALFSVLLAVSFLSMDEPARKGIFSAISAITSTGFSLGGGYPELSKLLLVILMIVGGFAGSIAGGLKLARVGILSKAVTWISKKIFYPSSAVVPFKFNGRAINDEDLTIISMFSVVYLLILVLSTLALSFMGYAPLDSFFVSASAEGTAGMTPIDIAALNPVGKVILIFDMLLGRLEILPFFVLFYVLYSRVKFR
jgi:trk system potassium uptake protein TrkH